VVVSVLPIAATGTVTDPRVGEVIASIMGVSPPKPVGTYAVHTAGVNGTGLGAGNGTGSGNGSVAAPPLQASVGERIEARVMWLVAAVGAGMVVRLRY